jgi:hypothetical protein
MACQLSRGVVVDASLDGLDMYAFWIASFFGWVAIYVKRSCMADPLGIPSRDSTLENARYKATS